MEEPIVKHCCNCSRSSETGKMENPLLCESKKAKQQLGKEAGNGICAKDCKYFTPLNHFSSAGLR